MRGRIGHAMGCGNLSPEPYCRSFIVAVKGSVFASDPVMTQMPATNSGAVEKIDRAYCCMQCRAVFLFRSDVEEHSEATGHGGASEHLL